MKRITVDEIFLLSAIADKIELKLDIPDTRGKSEKEIDALQIAIGKSLMLEMFKKIYKAKDEIKELIATVAEKDADKLTLKEIKETFTEILKQEGVLDFFK